jgi:ribosomal protein S18 acetylase RimI-like enzyme
MDIREYQEDDLHGLFEYWRAVGRDVPYFFPVSAERWQTCLLDDELDSETIFDSLETYLATEQGRALGFVQFGQPAFAWGESGQKYRNPHIGVIRHLYFDRGCPDVGEALLTRARDQLACFDQHRAFYHILGMSCNAHHGKLHSSQSHVEEVLLAHGFRVEHENAYYVLDTVDTAPGQDSPLRLCSPHGASDQRFEVRLKDEVVGTAQVRYLDALTDGHTPDVAYLTWIGVVEQLWGKGIGTQFLKLLIQFLLSRRVRYLHTDTASGNVRAQRFYERLGFLQEGYTRSYVRP